ncbi:hypothetical protein [Microtetraspora malaysiensis]|uniref:hypothetical protein n=1 Tax=Microtetraspora malaysiensis TaxID=161358 RepID=UPI003D920437
MTRTDRLRAAGGAAHQYGEVYATDPDAARPILEELIGSIASDAHIRPYGSAAA